MKWDMGWMHDTLRYLAREPIHRQYHHDELTFRWSTPTARTSSCPLSHDEVVHGKGSLVGKMPGDDWQKFANLRALYGCMFAQPGKKLLFRGASSASGGSGPTRAASSGGASARTAAPASPSGWATSTP